TTLGLAATFVLAMSGTAFAADAAPTVKSVNEGLQSLTASTNMLWVVIGAVLVIFMQAGFALVETGFCRAKHAAHVVSTNFAIFGLGFVGFFLVGYAIMFSGYSFAPTLGTFGYARALSGDSLIHVSGWVFLWGKSGFALSGMAYSVPVAAFFLY